MPVSPRKHHQEMSLHHYIFPSFCLKSCRSNNIKCGNWIRLCPFCSAPSAHKTVSLCLFTPTAVSFQCANFDRKRGRDILRTKLDSPGQKYPVQNVLLSRRGKIAIDREGTVGTDGRIRRLPGGGQFGPPSFSSSTPAPIGLSVPTVTCSRPPVVMDHFPPHRWPKKH